MADDLLTRFRAIAEVHDGVQVKGKKMPYTALNGNMFAFIAPENALCLRFDEPTRAGLAERFGSGPVLQYGSVMRGYVAIPEKVLHDEGEDLFAQSLAFVKSLPPKATKKR